MTAATTKKRMRLAACILQELLMPPEAVKPETSLQEAKRIAAAILRDFMVAEKRIIVRGEREQ